MISLLLAISISEQDAVVATLWECGTVGILEEQPLRWRAFFETADGAAAGSKLLIPLLLEIRKEDPAQRYSEPPGDFEPIPVGDCFVLTSSASNTPIRSGRLVIRVDAQSAFGSGRHQSTQLMMQALEHHVRGQCVVLDVGSGSGILSLAAQQLGAELVVACDIDPNAIAVVQTASGILLFAGSADSVRSGFADLVLANITAAVVDEMAVDLHRVAKPDGRVIVSGFTRERTPEQFRPETVLEADDWQCWIGRRDNVLAHSEPIPRVHARQWW